MSQLKINEHLVFFKIKFVNRKLTELISSTLKRNNTIII